MATSKKAVGSTLFYNITESVNLEVDIPSKRKKESNKKWKCPSNKAWYLVEKLGTKVASNLPKNLKLRIKKIIKVSIFDGDIQVPTFSSTNQTFATVVKMYVKVDIKVFLPCPILLDLYTLFQIFCLGLSEKTKFSS